MGYVKFSNIKDIEKRIGVNPSGEIQKFTTNTLYKFMDDFVPMRNGDLRKNVSIDDDSITYESNYAEYQYYGEREDKTHKVENYTTPGTGKRWDKLMWSAKKKEVLETIQKKVDGK